MEKLNVCTVCGYVAFEGAPEKCPVCCVGADKFEEKADAINPAAKEGKEKHVPVITVTDSCGLIPGACRDVHVQVGSTPHPMQADHSITWIDCYVDKKFIARYMMMPEALQATVGLHLKSETKGTLTVVENCNKHGLWMSEAQL